MELLGDYRSSTLLFFCTTEEKQSYRLGEKQLQGK